LRGTNFATGKIGTPLDFISFHAKGAPVFTNGHVRMGIANQLRTIDEGFAMVASFPELKSKPIIIGESDPEGCAACQGDQLAYRNGTMYSSYTAASFARKQDLALKHGVNFEGALTWAFEFEAQPFFAGFRSLASNGIDKPVLNVFRMFSKMRGHRIPAQSDHSVPLDEILKSGVRGDADVGAFASADGSKTYVMIWHYHDDDVPGPAARVRIELPEVKGKRMEHYRIDEAHSNAYTAWLKLGSPQQPTPEQYAALEKSGQLELLPESETVKADGGIEILLPRKAVSLLVIE
jgi:xylan 1,4-beta-xylosidase